VNLPVRLPYRSKTSLLHQPSIYNSSPPFVKKNREIFLEKSRKEIFLLPTAIKKGYQTALPLLHSA
jgi:hypothetical protein